MDFEFVSISDGKLVVAKAADVLFKKYYLDDDDAEKPFFTESYLTDALKTLGLFFPYLEIIAKKNSKHNLKKQINTITKRSLTYIDFLCDYVAYYQVL